MAFSRTLEPATNNLGSVVVNLVAGENGQNANFYADYQTFGASQDFGSTHGALPAGYSYELPDPHVSNIFSDFAGNSLTDTNAVGTVHIPPAGFLRRVVRSGV